MRSRRSDARRQAVVAQQAVDTRKTAGAGRLNVGASGRVQRERKPAEKAWCWDRGEVLQLLQVTVAELSLRSHASDWKCLPQEQPCPCWWQE